MPEHLRLKSFDLFELLCEGMWVGVTGSRLSFPQFKPLPFSFFLLAKLDDLNSHGGEMASFS